MDCDAPTRGATAYSTEVRCRNCLARWRSQRYRKGGGSYKGVKERLRRDLLARERGVCQDCGERVGDRFHAHHDVAQAMGGSNELGNLRLLCEACHEGNGWYRNHWELIWVGKAGVR